MTEFDKTKNSRARLSFLPCDRHAQFTIDESSLRRTTRIVDNVFHSWFSAVMQEGDGELLMLPEIDAFTVSVAMETVWGEVTPLCCIKLLNELLSSS